MFVSKVADFTINSDLKFRFSFLLLYVWHGMETSQILKRGKRSVNQLCVTVRFWSFVMKVVINYLTQTDCYKELSDLHIN
jgi:hypothetical protein